MAKRGGFPGGVLCGDIKKPRRFPRRRNAWQYEQSYEAGTEDAEADGGDN